MDICRKPEVAMNNKLPVIVCILMTVLVLPAFGANPVIVDDTLKSDEIGADMDYYEDAATTMRIGDVAPARLNWKKSSSDSFNFGFATSAYWFRFVIDNRQRADRGVYLEISYPMLDRIELFIPDGRGGFTRKT